MKTGDLTRLFGVSNTTIKNWIDRFPAFFSENAHAKNQRQRNFTEEDVLLLATIAQLSQQEHLTYEQVEDRLKSGYRVDNPGVANYGVDTRLIPAAAVEQLIDSSEIKIELERTKSELNRALELLTEERQRNTEKDKRIEELQDKIQLLQRELGRAEGRLEEQSKPRRRWF